MGWYADAVSQLEKIKEAAAMAEDAKRANEEQMKQDQLAQERDTTAQQFMRMAPAFGIQITAERAQEMAAELMEGDAAK